MKPLAADDPRVIGEYRLRAQLGAGGMGRVYLGLSPAGRAVAIKVVHPDLASDAGFLRRFGQEVAAARAVSGIYTAPVVASGLDERPPWLATAFVPGPSLDQVVSEHGPLPEQALWPLLAGLVEALQAIHACGVVHRDLKPANVLLATDGPRVIDFGIARAVDGTSLTAAGVVFGTPGYMSPEQAEGRDAGPASDVFALGCVVAYAAAGMAPFGTGTAAAILYRVVHAEPGPGPGTAEAPCGDRRVPGQGPGRPPVAAGAVRRDRRRHGRHRAVRGGVLAVLGGPPDRRLPGQAGGGDAEHQARRGRGFSWATAVYPPTTPSDPGRDRPGAPVRSLPGQQPPAPRWPYSGPGGAQASRCSWARRRYRRAAWACSTRRRAATWPATASRCLSRPVPRSRNGTRSRGATAPLPASMVTAVRLMYAGAAYALVWAIGILHVAGAGRGPGRGASERRVRAGLRGGLRGGGDGTVRHRDGGGHLVPGGARQPGPGRGAAPAPPGGRRLPGQGPGRPPVAARAVRHDRGRDRTPPGRPRWRSGRPRWPG